MEEQQYDAWEVLKRLFGDSELGIAKLSVEGFVEDCNAAFASAMDRDVDGLIGLSVVNDLTVKRDREDTRARFARMIEKGDPISTQKHLLTPGGGTSLCLLTASPEVVDGKVKYICDVLIRLPSSIDQLDILKQRIEDLEESKRVLEAANTQLRESLEQLLGVISHRQEGDIVVNQVGGGDQISGGGQKNVGNNSAKVIGVIAAAFAVCATAIVWIVFYTRPPHNGGDPAPPENLAIPAGQPEIQ